MSQTDLNRTEIQRMQPILVDAEGQVWSADSPFFWMRPQRRDGNIVGYAVAKLGFIHIWPVDGSSIVVSLRPALVHPKTMAASFYAIADLRPLRVYISPTGTTERRWELFNSVYCALQRIDRLVTAAWRSTIAVRLLRAWATRRRSNSAPSLSPPPRARRLVRLRRGKAVIPVSARGAAFLTSLATLSSLSFA